MAGENLTGATTEVTVDNAALTTANEAKKKQIIKYVLIAVVSVDESDCCDNMDKMN